uniref:Transmembrane protein n=1 Tax=Globisporangium ultimum (strain ATCC 200006 / CBS 805.95 / DAOM BR144) TaxID=431595 RepID=K3X7K9_GLOUD
MTPAEHSSISVYEPILDPKPKKTRGAKFTRYDGFEYQKRVWQSTARRSYRIRFIAIAQIVLGVLASWNYLWWTNLFGAFAGAVGLKAVRSDKMSWTIVYLLVCAMEFARNVMLAPHLYERYCLPNLVFSHYEYFQVAIMAVEVAFLIPAAFCVVFAATASLANPLW